MHFSKLLSITTASTFLALSTQIAKADIQIEFSEDAPKDFFMISNMSACTIGAFDLKIDLRSSAAGLLFDIEAGGYGENVSQPLEIASGHSKISALPVLKDGQKQAVISFSSLEPKQSVLLSVDVDDSQKAGPYGRQMISQSEIQGATVEMSIKDVIIASAAFNQSALARLKVC